MKTLKDVVDEKNRMQIVIKKRAKDKKEKYGLFN